jgi:cyclopropane fatty-acyl-phospholipid synthase-like methyltransferase
MRKLISQLLPNNLKRKIVETDYFKRRQAIQLAGTSKRIDICAAQFAHILHLSNHSSLEDKVCLELGAGWVLSHALICYLLGAKKVIATDIVPFAQPEVLSLSLKNAIASLPRDLLAPFSDHSRIRERYDRLLSIRKFSFDELKKIGIDYKSPVDFAKGELGDSIDFIYSFSVLEHVPNDDVSTLLHNLAGALNHNGTMIHCIHLEDHKNFGQYPFDFLKIPNDQYSRELEAKRGNRIRYSGWERVFSNLKSIKIDFIYRYYRRDKALPDGIDHSISYLDEDDLRTSHLGVYVKK